MKTSRLKKRSKQKITIDIVDRKLQDWFRKTYPKAKCESCGKTFYCMHHHLPKSRSNAGRYNHENLVFICHACHSEISFNGGSQVIARYSARKGVEWVKKMDNLAKERKQYYTKKELEEIAKLYE